MASNLSDIAGRAIWSIGSTFTEVQIPFIDDPEIPKRITSLETAIENKEKSYFSFLDSNASTNEAVKKDQDTFVGQDSPVEG